MLEEFFTRTCELTEYAKEVIRRNPEKVRALQETQKICQAIKSCGLTIITIEEMNVLLGR